MSKWVEETMYEVHITVEKYGLRKKFNEQLRKMDAIENHIISTGGGIVLKDDNKKLMKSLGLIIFLDINISSQMDRVKNRKNRPLLNDKNLKDNLLSLKKIRDPIYKKISNYIIDVSGKERNQVINEIQKII